MGWILRDSYGDSLWDKRIRGMGSFDLLYEMDLQWVLWKLNGVVYVHRKELHFVDSS